MKLGYYVIFLIYFFLTVTDVLLVVKKILAVLSDIHTVSETRKKTESFFKKIKFWESNVLLLNTRLTILHNVNSKPEE